MPVPPCGAVRTVAPYLDAKGVAKYAVSAERAMIPIVLMARNMECKWSTLLVEVENRTLPAKVAFQYPTIKVMAFDECVPTTMRWMMPKDKKILRLVVQSVFVNMMDVLTRK